MEIKDFFDSYTRAAWDRDADAMIALYHEELTVFDMWDTGRITDSQVWKTILRDWLSSLGEEQVRVGFEDIMVQESGELGFAHALITFAAIAPDGTILRSMKNRITLGFTKTPAGWKVAHQHTSAPVSSENLVGILEI